MCIVCGPFMGPVIGSCYSHAVSLTVPSRVPLASQALCTWGFSARSIFSNVTFMIRRSLSTVFNIETPTHHSPRYLSHFISPLSICWYLVRGLSLLLTFHLPTHAHILNCKLYVSLLPTVRSLAPSTVPGTQRELSNESSHQPQETNICTPHVIEKL